jgi:hypothetical protein
MLIKSIRCAICLCYASKFWFILWNQTHEVVVEHVTSCAVFSWKYFFFILSHLSQHWIVVLSFCKNVSQAFFECFPNPWFKKIHGPNAKYFSSYKSNKVDNVSFDRCIALTSLLLWWDRLGQAMANAFVGMRVLLFETLGNWDMLRKEELWRRTVFKEGHNFYIYFLRLWACGLALLFFGLWVFCGSFFLKGTVGCNNFWIG